MAMCGLCDFGRRGFGRMALGLGAALVAGGAPARQRHKPTRPVQPARPAQSGAHLPLVMLDPGHGGHDPGAIAPDGVFEKTITLASGLALRRSLLATGRYRVEMTRATDVFVTLEGRVAAAVAGRADLFLALHCDHLPNPTMRGASVFTLSAQASDGLAAGVAADENSADRFAGARVKNVSPQVADILASLETRATRLNSATLAQDIQSAFAGIVPMLPDPGRSANFAVLRDPSTPSTLLEMGCLTNPLDERLLTSPSHRVQMADRLTHAIDLYFANDRGIRVAG